MKLEIMAKNVVVGDVLVKGAHKYEVTSVEKIMYTDLVDITYKTMKTKTIRNMEIASTEFVKVEQVEEVAADPVEEPKEVNDNVVVHKVNAWNSASFSDFQFILEVDGNEFGYYMHKEENGDMKYKVVILGNDGFNKRNKVIGYESNLEGIEKSVNNFLSKGFIFFMWSMEPQTVRVKVVDAMEAFIEKIKAEKQEPKLVATYELGGILVDVYEDQTKDVPFSVTVPVPPKYSNIEHKYQSATKTFERESLERMHELMDYIGYRLVKEENGKFYIEVDSFDVDAGDVVKEKVFFDSEKPKTPSHDFEMHPGYGNIPKDEVAADPVEVKECEDKIIVKNENGHHVFIFGHVYNVGYGEGQEKELTFQVFNGNSLEFRNSNNDIFLFLPKDIVSMDRAYTEKDIEKFEHYHDLMDKTLTKKGLNDEEREEMIWLYKDLELDNKRNFSKLAQLSWGTKK